MGCRHLFSWIAGDGPVVYMEALKVVLAHAVGNAADRNGARVGHDKLRGVACNTPATVHIHVRRKEVLFRTAFRDDVTNDTIQLLHGNLIFLTEIQA